MFLYYLKKNLKFKILFLFLLIFVVFFTLNFRCYTYAIGVSARHGAIVIDSLTGEVLFEQDADQIAPIASTTKIVSTMVVLENAKNLDEPFVIDSSVINVEGTSMGLREGYVVTLRDLCYGMMLASGNDAANAAAIRVAGSVDGFVKMMNDRAKQLGCKYTVFKTPSGLDSEEQKSKRRHKIDLDDALKLPHSTARELAMLTREAMKNEIFREICSTKKITLKFGNPALEQTYCERTFYNHNKLLNQLKGICCGVKTGFTKNAGRCLVSAGRKNGVELIAVVLNDHDDWFDSKNLLNYCFSKFKKYKFNLDVSDLKLKVLSESKNKIKLKLEQPLELSLTDKVAGESSKRLKCKLNFFEYNFAPIRAGEKLGHAEYYLDDQYVGKVNLLADENVLS